MLSTANWFSFTNSQFLTPRLYVCRLYSTRLQSVKHLWQYRDVDYHSIPPPPLLKAGPLSCPWSRRVHLPFPHLGVCSILHFALPSLHNRYVTSTRKSPSPYDTRHRTFRLHLHRTSFGYTSRIPLHTLSLAHYNSYHHYTKCANVSKDELRSKDNQNRTGTKYLVWHSVFTRITT